MVKQPTNDSHDYLIIHPLPFNLCAGHLPIVVVVKLVIFAPGFHVSAHFRVESPCKQNVIRVVLGRSFRELKARPHLTE